MNYNSRVNIFLVSVFSIHCFFYIWQTISVLYLDINLVYAKELFSLIGGNGLKSLYLFTFFFLFIYSTVKTFKLLTKSNLNLASILFAKQIKIFDKFLFLFLFKIILFLSIIVHVEFLLNGIIPYFDNIDKGIFRWDYAGFFQKLFFNYQSFIFILIGFFYTIKKKTSLLIFFSFIIFLFFAGNKFSALIVNSYFFLIPISILNDFDFEKSYPFIKKFFFIILIILIIKIFTVFLDDSILDPFEYLINRVFIEQGQIFWITFDNIQKYGMSDISFLLSRVFFEPIADGHSSLFYLIEKIVGLDRLLFLLENRSQYTGAFPAILIELFGIYPSLLVAIFLGFIYAFFLYSVYVAFLSKSIVIILVTMFVAQPIILIAISGKFIAIFKLTYLFKFIIYASILLYSIITYNALTKK